MDVVIEGKEWSDGTYTIKHGPMPSGTGDRYHIYRSGIYMAQRRSLEDAQDWVVNAKKN